MKNIASIFCIVIGLYSCSNNSESNDSLFFNIDSSKIASAQYIKNFDISFHPPINWDEVDADISERIVNSLQSQKAGNNNYIYKPNKIYLNKITNSLLAVGIVEPPTSAYEKMDKLNEYLAVVSENFKSAITKEGKFRKDEISTTQFLIQKQNLISFKLIFELNKTIYQFDYTAQKKYYEQEIKSIESSMGTIKPITK